MITNLTANSTATKYFIYGNWLILITEMKLIIFSKEEKGNA